MVRKFYSSFRILNRMLLVPYFNHETDHGKYAANKNIYRNNILIITIVMLTRR